MKICVYGAGAVGGNLAVRLMSLPDVEVSIIARGAHLQAIRSNGLKLLTGGAEMVSHPVMATSDPAELPQQDIVFITLKNQALGALGAGIRRLLKPGGHVVFVNNGIPWWWHHGLPGEAHHLALVDPDKSLWDGLGAARCLGCAVYSMNEVVAPGVVLHKGNNSWQLGEPDNSMSDRLLATVDLMKRAGLAAEANTDIRRQILVKLLRNAALNPVCALTRLSVDQLAARDELVELCRSSSTEVAQTASAMGWNLAEELENEKRALQPGGAMSGPKVQGTKPSMLQDILAGRPTEIEAILGELQQFARSHGVATPVTSQLYALVKGLEAGLTKPISP